MQIGSALFNKVGIHFWGADPPASPLCLGGHGFYDSHNFILGKQVWYLLNYQCQEWQCPKQKDLVPVQPPMSGMAMSKWIKLSA